MKNKVLLFSMPNGKIIVIGPFSPQEAEKGQKKVKNLTENLGCATTIDTLISLNDFIKSLKR
ncbi:MAG: hypothetical protein WDK96_00295 [Candidatus Paceibacterota bacterium]